MSIVSYLIIYTLFLEGEEQMPPLPRCDPSMAAFIMVHLHQISPKIPSLFQGHPHFVIVKIVAQMRLVLLSASQKLTPQQHIALSLVKLPVM